MQYTSKYTLDDGIIFSRYNVERQRKLFSGVSFNFLPHATIVLCVIVFHVSCVLCYNVYRRVLLVWCNLYLQCCLLCRISGRSFDLLCGYIVVRLIFTLAKWKTTTRAIHLPTNLPQNGHISYYKLELWFFFVA